MSTWQTQTHGADCADSVILTLRPQELPTLEIRQGATTHYRTTTITQLLQLLDRSMTVEQLKREDLHVTNLPPLPPRTLMVRVEQSAQALDVIVTGFVPPIEYPFLFEDQTYLIALPHLVYQMRWREGEKAVKQFRLAVAQERPTAQTMLYRWPFSNVMHQEAVCWTARQFVCDLDQIVEKGVFGFLQTPNNRHGFGLGESHNGPQGNDYAAFLADVAEQGLKPEWLVPLGKTAAEFHNEA